VTDDHQSTRKLHLLIFLRFVGSVSLLAFLAAIMPANWIVECAEELGFDPFPDSPLTFYLARNLSLLYGFVGALMLYLSSDIPRYRELIHLLSIGTILFGGLQLVVDWLSGLPVWWTLGESLWTVFGGVLFYWLQRRANCQCEQLR
jgi:hypothetical protein